MKAVIQRVTSASVSIEAFKTSSIGPGLLILLGVGQGDTEEEAKWTAEKCAGLRIFEDEEGRMNRSLLDVGGSALVVSQFTLYGDCSRGRRPSFTSAAIPERARGLYKVFCDFMKGVGVNVETGAFGEKMRVRLENDGPVTIIVNREPKGLDR